MPKLTRNALLQLHPNPLCLILVFVDYKPNGTEIGTGKVLPSPNQTVLAFLRKFPQKFNFALISAQAGKVQAILLDDVGAGKALAAAWQARPSRPPFQPPYRGQAEAIVSMAPHIAFAKQLGIM
jgi:hypothetical protein